MLQFRRKTAVDGAVLTTVGIVLVLVHIFLPADVQKQLAFNHARAEPWMVFTAAFVHNSNSHLLGNVLGYAVGATVSYSLCTQQECRRWFWTTTLLLMIVVPILTNLTSYLAFRKLGIAPTARGFSGVVAAYAGFILIILKNTIASLYDVGVGRGVAQAVFILLLFEIAIIYSGVPSLLLIGLVIIGVGLPLGRLGVRGIRVEWTAERRRRISSHIVFTTLITVLLSTFVWVLFPAKITSGGATTNIIAHAAGFMWGIVVSELTSRIGF